MNTILIFYPCRASVTDGQSEVGCYCRGYLEETEADREYERIRSEREMYKRWEDERIINKIKKFFKRILFK